MSCPDPSFGNEPRVRSESDVRVILWIGDTLKRDSMKFPSSKARGQEQEKSCLPSEKEQRTSLLIMDGFKGLVHQSPEDYIQIPLGDQI